MRPIALLSDIHDRVDHLAVALAALNDSSGPAGGCEALYCLGDLCSPFVLAQLAAGFGGEIHLVFGNNDADTFRMTRLAQQHPHVRLHGEFATVAAAGKRVALTHFPEIARALDSAAFDLIAYGHDHRFHLGEHGAQGGAQGGSRLVNPGPLMGWDPGAGAPVAASFALWDPDEDALRGFRIDGDTVVPHAGDAGAGRTA